MGEDYLQYLRDALASQLQQRFDPRYNQVQAELLNMRRRNSQDWLGQPIIGSDTKGQSLQSTMLASPRWGDLAYHGLSKDQDLQYEIRNPMGVRGMDAMMEDIRKKNMQDKWRNMMMGGGI